MTTDLQSLAGTLSGLLGRHVGSTFTGAVLRIESSSDEPLVVATGTTGLEPQDEPVSDQTPFDLASLTKIFTATAVLRLAAAGEVEIDAPVRRVLPRFTGPEKDRVTVRHLLTHSSGLPALVRLYGDSRPSDPWDAIFGVDLIAPPGAAVLYSDVGFMLLGRLVAEVTGEPLRQAMQRLVLEPLHLDSVSYGPRSGASATEVDAWRGRRIRGEVHDENASVLGGASGHAGLFGAAVDVARLARAYLHPDGQFLPLSLVQDAISEQAVTGTERRGFGWKLRSPSPEASERAFSASTFGHYGFTGTAVWTDPARDLITVLLTNRVYFGRHPEGIAAARRTVFTAVADAFPEQASQPAP